MSSRAEVEARCVRRSVSREVEEEVSEDEVFDGLLVASVVGEGIFLWVVVCAAYYVLCRMVSCGSSRGGGEGG